MSRITTPEMECVLANYFDYRANLIVPCVHWGMDLHECDLLILSQAGYMTEVEIKISKADLRADAKKPHGHRSMRIKKLWFALPDNLRDCTDLVPARAGIILVSRSKHDDMTPRCKTMRKPEVNKFAHKASEAERYKLARLGALRIWRLKRSLL